MIDPVCIINPVVNGGGIIKEWRSGVYLYFPKPHHLCETEGTGGNVWRNRKLQKKKKGGGRCPVVWHTGNEEKIQSTINIYDLPVLKDTKIIF